MDGQIVKDKNFISEALQLALKKHGYDVPLELIDPLKTYGKPQAIRQLLRVHEHNDARINTALVGVIYEEYLRQINILQPPTA